MQSSALCYESLARYRIEHDNISQHYNRILKLKLRLLEESDGKTFVVSYVHLSPSLTIRSP
jgi:hypothetical protein